MCLGIPMRLVHCAGRWAIAEGRGGRRRIDLALLGEQPVGAWVLVHVDTAREPLDEERAAAINEALDVLEAALRGESIGGPLVDLPEPRLPDFLKQGG